MWISKSKKLPDDNKKYPVVINCDGRNRLSMSKFSVKKSAFSFDIAHINWKVVAWYDLPEFKTSEALK